MVRLEFRFLEMGKYEVYLPIAVENLHNHHVNLRTLRQNYFFKTYTLKTLKERGTVFVIRNASY